MRLPSCYIYFKNRNMCLLVALEGARRVGEALSGHMFANTLCPPIIFRHNWSRTDSGIRTSCFRLQPSLSLSFATVFKLTKIMVSCKQHQIDVLPTGSPPPPPLTTPFFANCVASNRNNPGGSTYHGPSKCSRVTPHKRQEGLKCQAVGKSLHSKDAKISVVKATLLFTSETFGMTA